MIFIHFHVDSSKNEQLPATQINLSSSLDFQPWIIYQDRMQVPAGRVGPVGTSIFFPSVPIGSMCGIFAYMKPIKIN